MFSITQIVLGVWRCWRASKHFETKSWYGGVALVTGPGRKGFWQTHDVHSLLGDRGPGPESKPALLQAVATESERDAKEAEDLKCTHT